jgi:hypothetical protein
MAAVLAAGGSYYGSLQHPVNGTATAEVWSPATGLWSETGSMASKRPGEFQMLLLQDGKGPASSKMCALMLAH